MIARVRQNDPPPKQPDPADFTLDSADWENAVFANRVGFTVILFRGRGAKDRWEFGRNQITVAMSCALDTEGNGGRQRLLYAITEAGRQIVLDRKDWPKWLEQVEKEKSNG